MNWALSLALSTLATLAPRAHATSLAERVRQRTCEADLESPRGHQLLVQLWLSHHAAEVLQRSSDLFIVTEDTWSGTVQQRFERAFATDTTLFLIGKSSGPPFVREPTEYIAWQAEVWPSSGVAVNEMARVAADRMTFDHESGRLIAGEFVLIIPSINGISAEVLDEILRLAVAQTDVSLNHVRGIRTRVAREERVFLSLDFDGDLIARYRATIRLMSLINDEIEHLRPL